MTAVLCAALARVLAWARARGRTLVAVSGALGRAMARLVGLRVGQTHSPTAPVVRDSESALWSVTRLRGVLRARAQAAEERGQRRRRHGAGGIIGALVIVAAFSFGPLRAFAAAPTVTGVFPSTGATTGGNFVIVAGSGFTGATAVDFGATAGSGLTVVSDSRVVITAPAVSAAGAVDVTVTTPGGTSSAVAADHYTYFLPAAINAWGGNGNGEIGDNSVTQRNAPVYGGSGLGSTVTKVVGGAAFTMALKSDGTVWTWGQDTYGELGLGNTTQFQVPQQVTSLSGIVDIAAGGEHAMALKSDGTVWDWGNNGNGELGINTSCGTVANSGNCLGSSTPVEVHGVGNSGFLSSIVAIAAGQTHSVALTASGAVYVWGDNNSYQVGTGSNCPSSPCGDYTPTASSTPTGIVTISAVYYFTVALRNDNTAWCWGDNPWGQCGNGAGGGGSGYTTTPTEVLTAASTPLTGVISAAAGGGFSLFATSSGAAYASGHNNDGQIGQNNNTTVDYPYATQVKGVGGSGTLAGVAAMDGGLYSSMAMTTSGAEYAWGLNTSGQLGVNSTTEQNAPVQVLGIGGTGLLSSVDTIQSGQTTALALVADPVVTSISPTSGPTGGGTSVVITGDNFLNGGSTGVKFGTTPAASFTVNSLTQITATSPAGSAGTVDVTVTTQTGTSDTSTADQFTYVVQPTVSMVTPNRGPTSGGQFVVISGANFVSGATVAFGGTASPTVTYESTTRLIATAPAATSTGTVDVVVTITGVASPTSSADQYTYTGPGAPVAWGDNGYNELGNGTVACTPAPCTGSTTATPVSNLTNVVAVSGSQSNNFELALRSDGTVWGWGQNADGQLGDGTTTQRSTPVEVLSGASSGTCGTYLCNIVAISAGAFAGMALRSDGTVWEWGYNGYGELGNATQTQELSPVEVCASGQTSPCSIPLTGVVSISALSQSSYAVTNVGQVYAWGKNNYGELGIGSTDNLAHITPALVVKGATTCTTDICNVVAISSVEYGAAALRSDGSVWTWGDNGNATLGNGTAACSPGPCTGVTSPVQASTPSGIIQVSTNATGHFLALRNDGTIWGWGNDQFGELGDATNTTTRATPVEMCAPGQTINPCTQFVTTAASVAASGYDSHFIETDTSAWAVGSNAHGNLGDGTTTDRWAPVAMCEGAGCSVSLTGMNAVAGSYQAGVAILATPTVSMIEATRGPSSGGQFVVVTGTNFNPLATVTFGGTAASGLTYVSTTRLIATAPAKSAGTGDVVVTVGATGSPTSTADQYTYYTTGGVDAWGDNSGGDLGNGSTTQANTPVQASGLSNVAQVAGGAYHSVAVRGDGTVWTWGMNSRGQLGDNTATGPQTCGTSPCSMTPVQVLGPGGTGTLAGIVAVAQGSDYHNVALKSDGTVWTWGDNVNGQLGDNTSTGPQTCGTTACSTTPVEVATGASGCTTYLCNIVAVAAGNGVSYALKSDGTVWAWGLNGNGQLGDNLGSTGPQTCGASACSLTPVQVLGPGGTGTLANIVSIAAGGGGHALALRSDGTVWTWGLNSYGQLGNGTTTTEIAPVQVVGAGGTGTLTGVTAITSIQGGASAVLKSDGSVWTWGWNKYGQLGDNTSTGPQTCGTDYCSTAPVQVVGAGGTGTLGSIVAISGGGDSVEALKSDGTLWDWGYNTSGQLGDNTATGPQTCNTSACSMAPVQVLGIGGTGNLVDVAAPGPGWFHSMAVLAIPVVTSVSPASGSALGGTSVTITGSGFTGATAATFGLSAGTSLVVTSDTQVTVSTPAESPGTVDTTVTTPNGTSATSAADQYTFNCSGGGYSVSSPATVTYPGITLNGTNQNQTMSVSFTVGDMSNTAAGWKLEGTSTTFTNGALQTLPTTATTVTGVASMSASSPSCSLPTNVKTYPITLPAGSTAPAAVPLYDANTGTGAGYTNVSLNFQLAVPANTYLGTFTSTWTFSAVTGP